LAGSGSTSSQGRVEVFYNNEWGTVCNDRFYNNGANIVCEMLGFARSGSVASKEQYGAGTGRILLDDVKCAGTESSIFDCPHRPWGDSNCGNDEDVGVKCKGIVYHFKIHICNTALLCQETETIVGMHDFTNSIAI
jgi:hypothetical protein